MTRETTEERPGAGARAGAHERWRRTLDVFEQSMSLDPVEREAFLDSSCASDPLLRRTLKEMIDSHARAETEGFMESPVVSYSPPDSNPRAMVGQQIGSYRLTQFIDQGGMGVVYLAEPAGNFFRRQAAVKLIRADLDPKQYRRFYREVQILADLKHSNLVFLYEAGRMADGRAYLAMEYVEGETLREWLKARGPMPIAMVVEAMKQASAGLDAAHAAGVIHRDIKPGNIMISEKGDGLAIKVLDFGIAARKEADVIEMSRTKDVIGTVLYMSPEQLRGGELTPASDVYALGLTVYELLTGQPAINGDSQAEIITKHLNLMPAPPGQLRPDLKIPEEIDRAVMKALAKDPNDRYQRAPDFAAELEAAQRAERTEELPRPSPAPAPVHDEFDWRDYAKPAAAVTAAVVVIAATYLFWRSDEVISPPPPKPLVSPPPAPSTRPRNLKLLLKVENTRGEPLANSSFALFKEGITTEPAKISEENAFIFRTDRQGRAETKQAEVKPGTYLMKAVRAGYKSIVTTVTLSEDRGRPGAVTLVVTLEPE